MIIVLTAVVFFAAGAACMYAAVRNGYIKVS